MERMEQMASLATDILREELVNDVKEIMSSLEQKTQQIVAEIASAVETALREAEHRQIAREKRAVSYISFSFLQSYLLLDRFAFRVDAWDERFMLDDREASSEWDFRTLVSCSGPDMNAVGKKVRETMIRVQDYELKELERAYRVNYFALAVEVLRAALPFSVDQVKRDSAELSPEIQFTVGPYMEQQQPIYIWRADK